MVGSYIFCLLLLCALSESTKATSADFYFDNSGNVSVVGHDVVDETNRGDVDGLLALKTQFILYPWNGDPCLDPILRCLWILCSSGPSPRVTALILGSGALKGTLPDFSSMDALEYIDFSNNQITGLVPSFLASFPNLVTLNLANNDFTGTVPAALQSNGKLELETSGNPRLVGKDSTAATTTMVPPNSVSRTTTSKSGSSQLPKILGFTFAILFVLSAIGGVFAIQHHKQKAAAAVAGMSKGQVNDNRSTGAAVHPDQTDQPAAQDEMVLRESKHV